MNWRSLLPPYNINALFHGYHTGIQIARLETECEMLRTALAERDERIGQLEVQVSEWQNYVLLKCQSPPLSVVRPRTQGDQTPIPVVGSVRAARRAAQNGAAQKMAASIEEMSKRAEALKNGGSAS